MQRPNLNVKFRFLPSIIKDFLPDTKLSRHLVCEKSMFLGAQLANRVALYPKSRPSHQPLPPVLHHPSGQGERVRARWLLRAMQHPECSILPTPNLRATCLFPPPPSKAPPIQTPEPQHLSVLHDWTNTVLQQNKSPFPSSAAALACKSLASA